MRMSKQGIAVLKDFEGCRLTAYLDVTGIPTIGYGFTAGVILGDAMTQDQCDARLGRELVAYEMGVMSATKGDCTQSEFDALVSLAWNIGIDGMQKSSVIKAHNRGDKQSAARAFGLWNKAGGKVVSGLTRRRAAEAALYLSDDALDSQMPQKIDPEKPMATSTTVIAGSTAAIATATQIADAVGKLKGSVSGLGDWFMPAVAVVALVAIGWVLYERYQNRARGAI